MQEHFIFFENLKNEVQNFVFYTLLKKSALHFPKTSTFINCFLLRFYNFETISSISDAVKPCFWAWILKFSIKLAITFSEFWAGEFQRIGFINSPSLVSSAIKRSVSNWSLHFLGKVTCPLLNNFRVWDFIQFIKTDKTTIYTNQVKKKLQEKIYPPIERTIFSNQKL